MKIPRSNQAFPSMAHRLNPGVLLGSLALCMQLTSLPALGGEGLRLRHPFTGSMVADGNIGQPAPPGWGLSLAYTSVRANRITNGQGNDLTRTIPIPALATSVTAAIDFEQKQDQLNLFLGYAHKPSPSGMRLAFVLQVPYVDARRNIRLTGNLPALPIPPQTAAMANTALQANLAAQSAAASGQASGFSDLEATALWIMQRPRARYSFGMTLIMPTGAYDVNRPVNPSLGDYFTLRPAVTANFDTPAGWVIGGRMALGFNTTNRATRYRSGHFMAIEGIAGYRISENWTSGVNLYSLRQIVDDRGPGAPADGQRLKLNSMGLFITWRMPNVGLLNIGWNKGIEAAHTFSGSAMQVRFATVF